MDVSLPRWQKITVLAIIIGLFCLGVAANTASPDEERVGIELQALKDGYAEQIRHAYNEAIDAFAVKGRQHAMGSFQRHLSSIRTVYKDCRDLIKAPR